MAAMNERENEYAAASQNALSASPSSQSPIATSIPNIDHRHGDGRSEILGIAVLSEYGEPLHLMMPNSRIIVRVTFRALSSLAHPVAGFVLRNHLGLDFSETSTERERHAPPAMRAGEITTVDFHLDIPEFYPGTFSFSPYVSEAHSLSGWPICDRPACDWIDNAITVPMARGEGHVYGYIQLPCKVERNAPLHALESRVA